MFIQHYPSFFHFFKNSFNQKFFNIKGTRLCTVFHTKFGLFRPSDIHFQLNLKGADQFIVANFQRPFKVYLNEPRNRVRGQEALSMQVG